MVSGVVERINALKKQKNAVIVAHNYQNEEVQEIADFTGDSLELARRCAGLSEEVIVFCGVDFMAETAAILSPQKTVLLPVREASCPMADMITAEELKKMKAAHPGALVVCYVNSSAEVKAESDVCCTSANAPQVVASLPQEREIIFVPDQYLGSYVQEKTGRSMILWPGFCPTHQRIRASMIAKIKCDHPTAKVMVHPECHPETRALADAVLSTGGMLKYPATQDAESFVVGTETGILYRLRKTYPAKQFIPVTDQALCQNMKMTRLEHLLWALENEEHRITVPEAVRRRAYSAVQRMLDIL
jgi:quinolinate synthase